MLSHIHEGLKLRDKHGIWLGHSKEPSRACCSLGEGQSRPVLSQAQSVFNHVDAFGVSVFLSLRFPPRTQVGSGAVEDVRCRTEKGEESQPVRPPGASAIGSVIRIYKEGGERLPQGPWAAAAVLSWPLS